MQTDFAKPRWIVVIVIFRQLKSKWELLFIASFACHCQQVDKISTIDHGQHSWWCNCSCYRSHSSPCPSASSSSIGAERRRAKLQRDGEKNQVEVSAAKKKKTVAIHQDVDRQMLTPTKPAATQRKKAMGAMAMLSALHGGERLRVGDVTTTWS